MRLLLLFLIFFLFCLPEARASIPTSTYFFNYLKGKGYPVISVAIAVDPPTNPGEVRIDFDVSASQAQIDAANAEKTSFNWTQPATPDPVSFAASLRTDSTLDATTRMQLASSLLPLLMSDISQPAALQQDWNDAKTVYGQSWLTPALQTLILNYASQYHIPIQ